MKRIDAWQTFDEARRIFIRIVLGRPIRASSSSSCFELRQHACRHLRKLIHTWTLLHIHWPRPDNVTINFDRNPANRHPFCLTTVLLDIHSRPDFSRLVKLKIIKIGGQTRVDACESECGRYRSFSLSLFLTIDRYSIQRLPSIYDSTNFEQSRIAPPSMRFLLDYSPRFNGNGRLWSSSAVSNGDRVTKTED